MTEEGAFHPRRESVITMTTKNSLWRPDGVAQLFLSFCYYGLESVMTGEPSMASRWAAFPLFCHDFFLW